MNITLNSIHRCWKRAKFLRKEETTPERTIFIFNAHVQRYIFRDIWNICNRYEKARNIENYPRTIEAIKLTNLIIGS